MNLTRTSSFVTRPSSLVTLLLAHATVLVAFFLRAYRLADKNVWWDEGWSVWLSQKDLAWIAWRTASDEHPPLHYWMLHFWNRVAGTDAFAGRFISLAFGVLTIALLYRIGKRVGGAWIGVLAAAFLATARFHIWWSQDIKNYTPSIFFAFAAVWFALELIADRRCPLHSPFAIRFPLLGYALFAALAMWTHYLAALVLLALNLYWLCVIVHSSIVIHRPPSLLWNWLIANFLAAAFFAPWMAVYLQNAAAWSAAPAFDFSLFLKLVATVLPLGVTTNIDNYAGLTAGFTILALLGCAWIIVNSKFKIENSKATARNYESRIAQYVLLFALIIALPPILIYILSLTPVSFFAPKIQARYLLILLPAYAMLLAFGVAFLARCSRYLAVFAILFVLAANAFVLIDYYAQRRLTDDYATLANTINDFARQGDLVLLDTDQEWPTFLYYLRAPLDWLGAPNGAPMTPANADALVQRARAQHDAVWLVTIPDALATDPLHLLETRLAREMGKQYERTVGDKRLALYAPAPRDFVSVARENFAPQYPRVEPVDLNARLLGFNLPVRELSAGDTLRLVTYWSAAYPAMVSVHLGNLITAPLQMPAGALMRYENDFAIPPDMSGDLAIAVNQFTLARVYIAPRAAIANATSVTHPFDVRLGDAIHLIGYDLPQTQFRAGDTVPLTLYWRADRAIGTSYTAFVHLVGAQFNPKQNNPLWGQIDHVPREGAYPTTAWLPNEIVPDAYRVSIDAGAPPGTYKIEVGLYDPATGARLPVDRGGDSVIVAEIEITR
jgi:mannosyltransferase